MLFLLVIIGSVFSIAIGRFETVNKADEAAQARLISEKVASTIEEVYSGGEGHEIKIEMPPDIKGSNYDVSVNQSGVLIRVGGWRGYSYSFFKKISNYDLTQEKVTMHSNKKYTVKNVKDGKINKVIIF
ncbi:hypothetical protein [uncultured Methanobacterium sp.]|uniref:hypothetical protein n=1 Tax=uncultured Methanobacterium sp. TaxID=176306 RepID=UPI002AA87263|nr:hypothetical protein [uncultured Methanobacterium sp.]